MNVGENNTVTISVEEYRKLLEIQARADLLHLRQRIRDVLRR